MKKLLYVTGGDWVRPRHGDGLVMCLEGRKALGLPESGTLLIASYPFKGSKKITMTSTRGEGEALSKRSLWFKGNHFTGWTGTWSDLCAAARVSVYGIFEGERSVFVGVQQ